MNSFEWRDGKVWWRCGRCGECAVSAKQVIVPDEAIEREELTVHCAQGVYCYNCNKGVWYTAPGKDSYHDVNRFPGVQMAARNLMYA